MALTGKTISELDFLQFPTNDTVIPVEYLGDTMHIAFSSITYNTGSYSQLVVEADNGLLTPGRFYLLDDYQTCYDQPNYTNEGTAILTGNYKTGTTEPILLLATLSFLGFFKNYFLIKSSYLLTLLRLQFYRLREFVFILILKFSTT